MMAVPFGSGSCGTVDKSGATYFRLEQLLSNTVRREIQADLSTVITVIPKKQDLNSGEWLVYVPTRIHESGSCKETINEEGKQDCLSKCFHGSNISCCSEGDSQDCDDLWSLYGSKLQKLDAGKYVVHLNRAAVFQAVIQEVLEQCDRYGSSEGVWGSQSVVMMIVDAIRTHHSEMQLTTSLNALRQLVVSQHLQALLQACGAKIHQVSGGSSVGLNGTDGDVLLALGISSQSISALATKTCSEELIQQYTEFVEHLNLDNLYVSRNNESFSDVSARDSCSCPEYILSLKKFLEDHHNLAASKTYCSNLSEVKVSIGSIIYQRLSSLEHARNSLKKLYDDKDMALRCIYIAESGLEFQMQQVDIAWRIMVDEANTVEQTHIACGKVVCLCAEGSWDTKSYYQLRHQQITDAYRLKYGDANAGGMSFEIDHLTVAVIRFELLSSICHQQVKLLLTSIDDDDTKKSPIDDRGGIFVMYNCARLGTLFRHYDESVEKGLYPPLPDVRDIDWSKLQEEAEWELLFIYVLPYPSIVVDCVKNIGVRHGSVGLHKISQFLLNLSNRLSTYYSKTRILCEPRPHLIPVIHARLFLMKAVQQVMHNALALLGIKPLEQM